MVSHSHQPSANSPLAFHPAGRGLGVQFLRHCERARVLVHLVDGTSRDPIHDYHAINAELELFSPELADKPQLVAYNKVDLPDSGDFYDLVCEHFEGLGLPKPVAVSAATGQGVVELGEAPGICAAGRSAC